jgi:D-alanyl-lipoteichoic acid acyltransferase DltB (MBOAT superfamily)
MDAYEFQYGITANLLALLHFKYSSFLIDNVNILVRRTGLPLIKAGHVPLPLGIAFLTFHTVSYLVDVRRGTILVEMLGGSGCQFKAKHIDFPLLKSPPSSPDPALPDPG